MDKKLAEEVVSLLISIDKPTNRILELLSALEDDEIKPIRKAVRKIGIDIYADILMPIFKKFPDLEKEDYYR